MERPTKIIHTALQETNTEQDGEVTHQDIKNFRTAIYRERRKKYGRLPKTLHETVATLRSMPLSTHIKEDTLMLYEENNGKCFVIFNTKLNLQTLCSADTVLTDGIFKSCPKPFYRLCTIIRYVNTFYIPPCFGLSLLPCDEVADSFTEDIMFDMPNDARCRQFADYVVNNFIAAVQTVTFRDTVGVGACACMMYACYYQWS